MGKNLLLWRNMLADDDDKGREEIIFALHRYSEKYRNCRYDTTACVLAFFDRDEVIPSIRKACEEYGTNLSIVKKLVQKRGVIFSYWLAEVETLLDRQVDRDAAFEAWAEGYRDAEYAAELAAADTVSEGCA